MNRVSFSNQKLIYILVHCENMTTSGIFLIQEALQEVLCTAAALAGEPRIPGIGIGLLKQPFQELLPLTPVKGCIDIITQRLQFLKELTSSAQDEDILETIQNIFPIIIKNAAEFSSSTSIKLKIIIFTWENVDEITKCASSCLSQNISYQISTIKVFQLIETTLTEARNLIWKNNSVTFETSGFQVVGDHLQADPYAIRMIFKEFLSEESGKDPHLQLTFEKNSTKTILFFDLRESSIDVNFLPSVISAKLTLPLTGVRISLTTSGKFLPIAEMECIQRCNFSSLSSNWLSGTLTYLLPSSAEKFSFQEFWDNSQRIHSLNGCLHMKQETLICRRRTKQGGLTLLAYFAIFSFNKGLAIAQIVPPELTLIEMPVPMSYDIPKKFKDQMNEILEGIEISEFKIEQLHSDIAPTIINHLSRKPTKGIATRKVHPFEKSGAAIPVRGRKDYNHPCFTELSGSYKTG